MVSPSSFTTSPSLRSLARPWTTSILWVRPLTFNNETIPHTTRLWTSQRPSCTWPAASQDQRAAPEIPDDESINETVPGLTTEHQHEKTAQALPESDKYIMSTVSICPTLWSLRITTTDDDQVTANGMTSEQSFNSSAGSNPVTFFSLPLEVRYMVYKLSISFDRAICIGKDPDSSGAFLTTNLKAERSEEPLAKELRLGMLSTCKQCHVEAAPIFYSTNKFVFSHIWDPKDFLEEIGQNKVYLREVAFEWATLPSSWQRVKASIKSAELLSEAVGLHRIGIHINTSDDLYVMGLVDLWAPIFLTVYKQKDCQDDALNIILLSDESLYRFYDSGDDKSSTSTIPWIIWRYPQVVSTRFLKATIVRCLNIKPGLGNKVMSPEAWRTARMTAFRKSRIEWDGTYYVPSLMLANNRSH